MRRATLCVSALALVAGCATTGQRKPLVGLSVEHVALSESGDCAQIQVVARGGHEDGYILVDGEILPVVSLVSTSPPRDHIRLAYASFEYAGVVLGYIPLSLVEVPRRESVLITVRVPLPFTPRETPARDALRVLDKQPGNASVPLYFRVAVAWVAKEKVARDDRETRTIERGQALIKQEVFETDDVLIDSSLPVAPGITCRDEPSKDYTRAISTQVVVGG